MMDKSGVVPIGGAVSSYPNKTGKSSKQNILSKKKYANEYGSENESDDGPIPPTPAHAKKSPRHPDIIYTNKAFADEESLHDRSRQELLSS